MDNLNQLLESLSIEQTDRLRQMLGIQQTPKRKIRNSNAEPLRIAPQCALDGTPLVDTKHAPDLRMRYDYYSAVWNNHTLGDILEYYGLTPFFEQLLKTEAFRSQFKTDDLIRVPFNDFTISIPYSYADRVSLFGQPKGFSLSQLDIINIPLDRVLINISGAGLEWMRKNNLNPEHILRVPPNDSLRFHVTRVDFAFDFKNFKYDFFEDCMDFLNDDSKLTETRRLMVTGASSPLSFRFTRGQAEIIYLGASASERLLRMYDKKLEQSHIVGGVPIFDSDFWGDPQFVTSWLRIEWQTRKKQASDLLFNDSNEYWLYILKKIHEFYSFRDYSGKVRGDPNSCPVADFWQGFWSFDIIGHNYHDIVAQNGHFVQYTVKPDSSAWDKNLAFVDKSWKRLLCLAYQVPTKCNIEFARNFYLMLMIPDKNKEAERIRMKRYMAFISHLNEVFQGNIEQFFDNDGYLLYPQPDGFLTYTGEIYGENTEI